MRFMLLLLLLAVSQTAAARPLAFPGAVGFGASAEGGRGGDVYAVTTLADDGPGSRGRESRPRPARERSSSRRAA